MINYEKKKKKKKIMKKKIIKKNICIYIYIKNIYIYI